MVTSTEVNVAALLLLKDALPFATGVDVKKETGGGEAKKLTFSRNSSATKANPRAGSAGAK